jgi:hypothetical protein
LKNKKKIGDDKFDGDGGGGGDDDDDDDDDRAEKV